MLSPQRQPTHIRIHVELETGAHFLSLLKIVRVHLIRVTQRTQISRTPTLTRLGSFHRIKTTHGTNTIHFLNSLRHLNHFPSVSKR